MGIRHVIALNFAAGAVLAAEPHWAYVPPVAEAPPGREGEHPVDAFLDAARKKAGLAPVPEASPRQWLLRAAYTLTGLPPGEDQLRRITATPDDATRRAITDELLASPAYGERWARHWMDVARYADTSGYAFEQDNRFPFAYTYRDWLISAFNRDLPYAKFVELQIAADLMVDRPDHPDLAALGFITVGPRSGHEETVDDRVDVVTRGFLGSTISCARCHDHKSDPITTRDYYSIYSILDNVEEPAEKPVVGAPPDAGALQAYQAEAEKLLQADLAVRQALVDQVRNPQALATYLGLGWRALQEDWDHGRATSEAFKKGRFRAKVVMKWKEFLKLTAVGDKAHPRVSAWHAEMAAADEAGQAAACTRLAEAWLAGGDLASLATDGRCPLSFGADRAQEFMDTEDDNARRTRASTMSRLQIDHPGSPPRAMVLKDKPKWSPAVVFKRGNPANRSEPFERAWPSCLGGGEFPKDRSARLGLAEKIADPANPLTARVIVNRVWAWNFGTPLTDPADFGVQQPDPALRPLLDYLSVWFVRHGGSIKELNRLLVSSRAFRLAADGPPGNDTLDEANTLYWKWNRRRLDFEVMRDHLLASAGALDVKSVGGRSVKLDDASSDRRRGVYAFIDRYALPGVFVSFDLPHPDHLSAGRGRTMVPQQALYFLNSPLPLRRAAALAGDAAFHGLPDDSARVTWLYRRMYFRDPTGAEVKTILEWMHRIDPADYQPRVGGMWEVRHAVDAAVLPLEVRQFPLFADGVWKTGPDPANAPIRWLNVGNQGGHVAAGHAMILRWRATSPGEVSMQARLKRTQKGGAVLAWRIDAQGSRTLAEGKLQPEAETHPRSGWLSVRAGDTVDLVLRAPEGDTCGNLSWDIKLLGRDAPSAPAAPIADFAREFPKSGEPVPAPGPADPWADVIQMLWASNEFNFIE